ncbi:conserved oligomeric Golgi complex subunit 1-like [Oscarella lobularis]|uniref:conserved oligomeric Golgi complex subunit 1-like n=1 Tax=Oscarella lobularis TaxID=121494 RepID=UPI00331314AC
MATAGQIWNREEDTSRLFQNHTIDEIRQIEKKIRNDIEKKKEDLRQMVGERYPELIDAADTITEMSRSSADIVGSVDRMHGQCRELKETHQCRGIITECEKERSTARDNYEMACHLKFLVDTPEKIWTALDSERHLEAASLYLKAQKIVKSNGEDQRLGRILPRFPILQQQWTSVSHFKDVILQASKQLLQSYSGESQTIAESLCAILLLEESTPRQVFTEFLVARKAAIQALFHTSQRAASVKSQICSVASILVSTVVQIDAIFNRPSQSDAKCFLLEVMSTRAKEAVASHFILSWSNSLSISVLHSSCQEWMATCLQDVKNGLQILLAYITSIKSLTSIRDAVYALLLDIKNDIASNRSDKLSNWQTACLAVVGRRISIWDEFVRPLVVKRIEEIISERFAVLTETAKRLTKDALERIVQSTIDRDVSAFVWSESGAGGTSLQCQARGCAPMIREICLGVESHLNEITTDIGLFLDGPSRTSGGGDDDNDNDDLMPSSADKDVPFDCLADDSHLKTFTHTQSCRFVETWTEWMETELGSMHDEILYYGADHAGLVQGVDAIDRCLFLGRLCHSLLNESSSLRHLITDTVGQEAKRARRGAKSSQSAEIASSTDLGVRVTDQLRHVYASSYRSWIEWINRIVTEHLELWLSEGGSEAWLSATSAWEEIRVREESEGGAEIESKIQLPFQVSGPVFSFLFALCQEIGRASSYSLEKSIKDELINTVYNEIVSRFERLRIDVGDDLTQRQAVQWMFDLRFVTELLGGKVEKAVRDVHAWLESRIDPFDLSVFQPFLDSNLSKHIQRASVMLGPVHKGDSWNKRATTMTTTTTSGAHDQHNVLALTQGVPRFTLLPHHHHRRHHQTTNHTTPTPTPKRLHRGTGNSAGADETATPQLGSLLLQGFFRVSRMNVSARQTDTTDTGKLMHI